MAESDFDGALKYYDQIVKKNIGVKEDNLKNIKAQAFLNKGTVIYARDGDAEKALPAYQAGHKTFPSALSADTLSVTFALCDEAADAPGRAGTVNSVGRVFVGEHRCG